MGNSSSNLPTLQTVVNCQTAKVMGLWYVIAVKPTMFEKTCSNAVERYTLTNNSKSHDINIDFDYNQDEPLTSKLKSLPQKGWIQGDNKENSGLWKVSPFWPVKMPYNIIEVDDKDYSYVVIGYPSREYCWIMSRTPTMDDSLYNTLTEKLVEKHQYSLDGLRKVPQKWTLEERKKRGLSEQDLPAKFLEG